jgi:hypothetical protein
MKKILVAAVAAIASLTIVAGAAAALDPGVYDPGNTGCVKATMMKNKTLHLEKNCPTATDAAAGAQITGVEGQTFQSAEFTLKSSTQCQGGSPRFVIVASGVLYHVGCNNVTPTQNADGTATYLFNAATLAAAGQQVPTPTGTISFVSVLIDVQGVADLTKIKFNGVTQRVVTNKGKGLTGPCKNGGWKTFTSPKFKNQGQCVSSMVHARNAAKKAARG